MGSGSDSWSAGLAGHLLACLAFVNYRFAFRGPVSCACRPPDNGAKLCETLHRQWKALR